MTTIVNKNDFLTAIKSVKTATAKANLQPILSAIHLKTENGGLTLTATDCSDIARAVIEANTTEPIDVCIMADRLENIVSRLDDEIKMQINESNLVFKSGKTVFKCLFMQSSEFPTIDINLSDDKIILSKDDFISGVNKTVFATAGEEVRSVIANVCLTLNGEKGYELAATDGNRLSQVCFDVPINKIGKYVIPKNALISIAKTVKDEVEIYFTKETVTFKTNNFVYVTRLFNGEFPPYSQLIPKKFEKTIILNRAELIKALDKVSIMANDKTNITKFIFTENNLQLVTECPDGDAKDDIDIDYTNDNENEFNIAFNYLFILSGLKAMTTDEITFNFNNNVSATLISGDYNYLVMPIQIKS